MRIDRPPPGEELNTGDVTPPRASASVILLRDSPSGPEVLLVQRNLESRFMGGAWVFPGGATDAGEDHAACAVRELREEAGVELPDPAGLHSFSNWITPVEVKIRFDTLFFVARLPAGAEVAIDGAECVDYRWVTPSDALAAGEREEILIVFPTIKHLEQLVDFADVAEAVEAAAAREVSPITPKVVVREDGGHVLLPGDDGYDDA